MQRGVRFGIGLAALVAVTLGLKLALFTPTYARPDDARLERQLLAAFRAEGFSTGREAMLGRHAIRASRGECELLVARIDSRGHGRDRFALAAAGLGPVEYLYRGKATRDFPRFRPLIEEQLWRFTQAVRGEFAMHPILAIAGTGACGDVADILPIPKLGSPE